jgi:hypothetical protein
MCRYAWVALIAVCATACTRPADESVKTPLPTRQTTIDPVTKKLDAATKDIERRRQDVDDSTK